MYICPICNREYVKENLMSKHLLVCWKEHNPNHQSNDAPRSEDIVIRKVDNSVLDFFSSFEGSK